MLRPPLLGIPARLAAAGRAFVGAPDETSRPTLDATATAPPLFADLTRNPWLRFGAAVIVGYAAGSFNRASATRALVRRLVVLAASAIMRDVFLPTDPGVTRSAG